MITLITGVPGSGKTLYAITSIKAKAEKEGRDVYYSGIADLTLPWTEIDGEKWFDAPPNSIVVIDECQRIFRPRGNGSQVPKYVSELETHRHKGLDLYVITQHPMLMDSNVRRLIGNHFHVSRRFGMQRASIFEYESCKDQPLAKIDSATARHEWKYPKDSFAFYKSAEVHTYKARIPKKFFMILIALIVTGASVWFFVDRWAHKIHPDKKPRESAFTASNSPGGIQDKNDPLKYFQDRNPRLVGLPASAPVYDKVTEPVRAPMPVACVQSASRCQCYSQQGTRIDTGKSLCLLIVKNGYFVDWAEKKAPEKEARRPEPVGGSLLTHSGAAPETTQPSIEFKDTRPTNTQDLITNDETIRPG